MAGADARRPRDAAAPTDTAPAAPQPPVGPNGLRARLRPWCRGGGRIRRRPDPLPGDQARRCGSARLAPQPADASRGPRQAEPERGFGTGHAEADFGAAVSGVSAQPRQRILGDRGQGRPLLGLSGAVGLQADLRGCARGGADQADRSVGVGQRGGDRVGRHHRCDPVVPAVSAVVQEGLEPVAGDRPGTVDRFVEDAFEFGHARNLLMEAKGGPAARWGYRHRQRDRWGSTQRDRWGSRSGCWNERGGTGLGERVYRPVAASRLIAAGSAASKSRPSCGRLITVGLLYTMGSVTTAAGSARRTTRCRAPVPIRVPEYRLRRQLHPAQVLLAAAGLSPTRALPPPWRPSTPRRWAHLRLAWRSRSASVVASAAAASASARSASARRWACSARLARALAAATCPAASLVTDSICASAASVSPTMVSLPDVSRSRRRPDGDPPVGQG